MASDEATTIAEAPKRLTALQLITGLAFMTTGTLHFVAEKFFTAIVPRSLPNPKMLVYVSGVAEFAGGLGVLIPGTRRLAGKGLLALLIAVFPANINMAVNADRFKQFPAWSLWARLPLQFLMIRQVW
ncbi:MAG: DoxX family protein, partial [Solirubrobacterales bacterium]